MINPYIIGAVALALIGSHGFVYHKGKEQQRDKATAAALEFREKEQKLIAELDKAKQQREIIYRDKIKIIKEVDDACGSSYLPQPVFDLLRSLNDSAERGADPRLRPSET